MSGSESIRGEPCVYNRRQPDVHDSPVQCRPQQGQCCLLIRLTQHRCINMGCVPVSLYVSDSHFIIVVAFVCNHVVYYDDGKVCLINTLHVKQYFIRIKITVLVIIYLFCKKLTYFGAKYSKRMTFRPIRYESWTLGLVSCDMAHYWNISGSAMQLFSHFITLIVFTSRFKYSYY